nr:diphthine methyltransferase [Onthophagus taurus]
MLTLNTYKTELNADSLEFCPHEPNQNVFVCANYQLEKDETSQTRKGLLLLFSIEDDLNLLQTIGCSGVLDTKWCRNKIGNRSILGVVNATKSIEIYVLNLNVNLVLQCKLTIPSEIPQLLLLSLDWSSSETNFGLQEIVCSDSKGSVHRLIYQNNQLTYLNGYKPHDFECWCVTFNHFNSNIFYSGGDDTFLFSHDSRIGDFTFKNKSHTAGVTSIQSNPHREHLLATGSYDSYLRIWDDRKLKDCLFQLELPGTLWRLKWDPFGDNLLLAGCMSGGAHIVQINDCSGEIIGGYNEHESLVYGVDWSWLSLESIKKIRNEAQYLIGTCSFYDNLMCLTTFNT